MNPASKRIGKREDMLTARIVTDTSDTSTVLVGGASILLMRHEPGALLADGYVEIEIDEDGGIIVSVGEGDDEAEQIYDSRVAA